MAQPTAAATRNLPPLMLRATVRPGSVDPEKRTAEVVFTTGARVLRGFWERYYEELSLDPAHVRMERLNNGAPLLNAHNGYDCEAVLGVVEPGTAKLTGGQGVAVVRFAKAEDDPEADVVFRKVKDGILQNVSVGYRVHKMEQIEGGDEQIPVYRCTDWEPFEISVVPMGADDGAGFRSTEARELNACVLVARSKERTVMENETPAAPAAKPAAPATQPDPAAAEAATRQAREAGAAQERERSAAIRGLVAKHKLGEGDAGAKFLARLLEGEGGKPAPTLEQARSLILDELAARSAALPPDANAQHRGIEAGEDKRDKFLRGAEAAILVKAGLAELVRSAKETSVGREALRDVVLDPGEFRRFSVADLAREYLERSGEKVRGSASDIIGKAFVQRGAMQTTSDFAILLESAMHKVLLAAYATAPHTWRRFCRIFTVPDFRSQNLYRVGSIGTLDSLNEHGEFKRKAIPDGEKAQISADTKGNIIGITRKALVNDDLGAFNDLGVALGRAAQLTIDVAVYDLIKQNSGLGPTQGDGQPFFATARANINATGSALTVDGVESDGVVMALQTDVSGNEVLDLSPAILLIPKALEGKAKLVNTSATDPDIAGKVQVPNRVNGMYRDIVASARLTGTRRYSLADPMQAPAFAVAFLDGQESPELERKEGWDMDGVELRVKLDFGVAAVDFRGAVTNAGQ